jgi:hypothetical protein
MASATIASSRDSVKTSTRERSAADGGNGLGARQADGADSSSGDPAPKLAEIGEFSLFKPLCEGWPVGLRKGGVARIDHSGRLFRKTSGQIFATTVGNRRPLSRVPSADCVVDITPTS